MKVERGDVLHYVVEGGDDLECSVTDDETEFAWDGEASHECVEVCFLDAGAGYSKGEVGFVSVEDFREFEEGE